MTLPVLGQSTCTLDSKRRVTLPAKIRELWGLTGEVCHLILTIGHKGCLQLFTPSAWDNFAPDILKAIVQGDEDAIRLRDILAQLGSTVRVDRSGRIALTDAQMEYAGLSKEVVIFSNWTLAELWSPERYAETHPEPKDHREYDELLKGLSGVIDRAAERRMGK